MKYLINIALCLALVTALSACASSPSTESEPESIPETSAVVSEQMSSESLPTTMEEEQEEREETSVADLPEEVQAALDEIMPIADVLSPDTGVPRSYYYNGTETIDGLECYTFTLYAETSERYETLGIYAKAADAPQFYLFDELSGEYKPIEVGETIVIDDQEMTNAPESVVE